MTDNSKSPLDLLRTWVVARTSDDAARWFGEQLTKLAGAPTEKDLHLALGYAPRRLGKADLALPHLRKAIALEPGNEVPYYQLSLVYRDLGNAPEQQRALAEFQRLKAKAIG